MYTWKIESMQNNILGVVNCPYSICGKYLYMKIW
jgi:hypothetical protein